MDGTESIVEVARETLSGDVRDFLLDRLKHDKSILPWNMQSEDQQREAIAAATDAARHLVERVVKIVAADGRSVMTGTLIDVKIKDGIKATIKLSQADPLRHELADATGKVVLICVAATDPYEGEKKPAVPEPNQRQMFDDPPQQPAE